MKKKCITPISNWYGWKIWNHSFFMTKTSDADFDFVAFIWRLRKREKKKNAIRTYSLNFRSCFFFLHSFDTWIYLVFGFFFLFSDLSENVHITRWALMRKKKCGWNSLNCTLAKNEERWLRQQVHGSLAITNKTSYVLFDWYASNR